MCNAFTWAILITQKWTEDMFAEQLHNPLDAYFIFPRTLEKNPKATKSKYSMNIFHIYSVCNRQRLDNLKWLLIFCEVQHIEFETFSSLTGRWGKRQIKGKKQPSVLLNV